MRDSGFGINQKKLAKKQRKEESGIKNEQNLGFFCNFLFEILSPEMSQISSEVSLYRLYGSIIVEIV